MRDAHVVSATVVCLQQCLSSSAKRACPTSQDQVWLSNFPRGDVGCLTSAPHVIAWRLLTPSLSFDPMEYPTERVSGRPVLNDSQRQAASDSDRESTLHGMLREYQCSC